MIFGLAHVQKMEVQNMFVVVAGMGHIQHMSALGCAAVSRRVRSLGLFWVKLL